MIKKKNEDKDAARAKSKEDETGAKGGKDDPNGKGKAIIIDLDAKESGQGQDTVAQSGSSLPMQATAANTASIKGSSMHGA